MDEKTRYELYKSANSRLEATLDCMRNIYECFNEVHSNLFTIFHLLHVANRDIENVLTIDAE